MDEQRHQKELIEMIKQGRWNPEYFNKPALHFYMRMIPTIISYFSLVFLGKLKSFDNIVTSSPYVRGELSCSSNPPEILLVNRFFSFFLVFIGIYALSVYILYNFNFFLALLFSISTVLAPGFYQLCCKLSVDPLGFFFACLVCLTSYHFYEKKDARFLMLSAFFSGLLAATKYNFSIFALVPIILSFTSKNPWFLSIKIVSIIFLSFCLVNPFIFLNYRHFIDDITVQITHYRKAVDVPFLQRLWLNFLWIQSNLPLYVILGLGISLVQKTTRIYVITIVGISLMYFLEMSVFRQLFYRNFFPLIPALHFAAILGIDTISRAKRARSILIISALHLPIFSIRFLFSDLTCFDSRKILDVWLEQSNQKTFLSGQICNRAKTQRHYYVEVFDEKNFSYEKIASEGGRYVIFRDFETVEKIDFFEPKIFFFGRKETLEFPEKKLFSLLNIPIFNPPFLIFEINYSKYLEHLNKKDRLKKKDLNACERWCIIQEPFTELLTSQEMTLMFENPHPKPNLIRFICDHLKREFIVYKRMLIDIKEIPCNNPIFFVRDILNPTKYYIPEDRLIGIKVKKIN